MTTTSAPRPLPLMPRVVNNIMLWSLAAPTYASKVIAKADN